MLPFTQRLSFFLLLLQLYNVVVDTEVTGKKLLQKGELKRRYTIIPLNKISARAIDDATVKRAEQLVSVPSGFLVRYPPGPLTMRQPSALSSL